jgi:molybdate transport system ATP-binding protein
MLRARLSKRLASFALDVELEVESRSVLVVVGESGSGKTTLLRLLAGLAAPDEGRVEVDGRAWFERASGRSLPPHQRPVGYVAQDYALFPHLTAAENVAFGLRAARVPARERRVRVAAVLERLGIGELADRRPRELSGGQQQRVAIARAVVLEPRLLLFDEPLSALDASSRRTIRRELHALLRELGATTLYVTHHPAEALSFGERIAVLEHGRVSQSGTREDLMRHPRSPYVAEFLGVNLFRGVRSAGGPRGAASDRPGGAGAVRVALPDGELVVTGEPADSAGDVAVLVRPRDIALARERPSGTARNVFAGAIEELVPEPPDGALVRVALATAPRLTAEVTREAVRELGLAPGVRVFASFKASGVSVVGEPEAAPVGRAAAPERTAAESTAIP